MRPGVVAGAWRLAEWGWDAARTRRWIEDRLELGVTHFDLADVHGDTRVETLFGQALRGHDDLRRRLHTVCTVGLGRGNGRRPLPSLAAGDASPPTLAAQLQRLLLALDGGPIDLLLLQCPSAVPDTQGLDALAALLQGWQRDGRVRAVGASHWPAVALADLHARVPLAAHQVECSLLHPDAARDGTLQCGQALGIVPMAWSPLAGGRLVTGVDPETAPLRARLDSLAVQAGCSPVALACAWLAALPGAPRPVVGARRLDVVQQALQGTGLKPSPEVLRALDELAGFSAPGARPAGR